MALEPMASRAGRASTICTGTPRRARSRAVVWPTGPAPSTSTGVFCTGVRGVGGLMVDSVRRGAPRTGRGGRVGAAGSVLELVPDLAVTFGGPDDGSFDAGEFVPEPGDVEGQAVFEDGPVAVVVDQGGVGGVECFLEGAAAFVDGADLVDHHVEEVAGLFDGGFDLVAASADGSASADEHRGVEGLDPVEGGPCPVLVEGIAGVESGLCFDEVTCEEDLVF